MKNLICILIVGLSFFPIISQNRVDISEIEIKKNKMARSKTNFLLDGKKYSGMLFENWENVVSTNKDGHSMIINENYHKNGNVMDIDSYKDGEPHGRHLYYDEFGALKGEENFKNGVRHGFEIHYREYGAMEKTLWTNGKRRMEN